MDRISFSPIVIIVYRVPLSVVNVPEELFPLTLAVVLLALLLKRFVNRSSKGHITMFLKRAAVFTLEYIHLNTTQGCKGVEGLFV